jgi:hypothetical protein
MDVRPCTVISWKVNPDSLALFLETMDELLETMGSLPAQPGGLILSRAVDDPLLFHSLSWWETQADLEAMRAAAHVRDKLEALVALCTEVAPSAYELVRAVS